MSEKDTKRSYQVNDFINFKSKMREFYGFEKRSISEFRSDLLDIYNIRGSIVIVNQILDNPCITITGNLNETKSSLERYTKFLLIENLRKHIN